ncbi:MAG TPA: MBL fold metallo-hydrolase [Phycisphaerae bacterium]|nr:MBL fold metallo-hydrolase [Phycisphaerae bacterium]
MSVELIILVDNAVCMDGLQGEHGLSILISGPGRRVLFDAAATAEALLGNAAKLGVDLSSVDTAVISHGHCDHTGGLEAIVRQRPGLQVYVHSAAFNRRWADRPGKPLRDISCPHSIERLYQSGAVFHSVTHPEPLEDWLVVSGPIGGPKHGREVFVVRKGGEMVVDGFEDEMCLLIRGQNGWTVVTGCCHRGLRNTLRTAQFLTHAEPLTALVGGLHLGKAEPFELDETLDLLRQYDLHSIYPCHCTGKAAVEALRKSLPGRVHPMAAGSRVIL